MLELTAHAFPPASREKRNLGTAKLVRAAKLTRATDMTVTGIRVMMMAFYLIPDRS